MPVQIDYLFYKYCPYVMLRWIVRRVWRYQSDNQNGRRTYNTIVKRKGIKGQKKYLQNFAINNISYIVHWGACGVLQRTNKVL